MKTCVVPRILPFAILSNISDWMHRRANPVDVRPAASGQARGGQVKAQSGASILTIAIAEIR